MIPRTPSTIGSTGALLLFAGCIFDSFGIGTEDEPAPVTTTTTGTPTTTGDPVGSSSTTTSTSTGPDGTTDGTTGTSTGDPCRDGCPPTVGWTVIGEAGEGVGHALVVDADDDVIVAGDKIHANDPTLHNIWVGKFAGADGELQWERTRSGEAKRNDFARGVVLAPGGAVIVAGGLHDKDATKIDVFVGSYTLDGSPIDETNLGTTHWAGMPDQLDEWANDVAFHPDGDLLLGGRRCKRPCVTPEAWVGRYADGVTTWGEPMLYLGDGTVRGVVPWASGFVQAGTDGFDGKPGAWRSRVREHNEAGGAGWTAAPDEVDANVEATALKFGPDDRLWVVGREFVEAGEFAGFIRVYDLAVGEAPVAELRGADVGGTATAVVVFADGDAVVAGSTGERLWLARFDAQLTARWRLEADDPLNARGLAIDGAGDLLVLGALPESRTQGERLWLRKYVTAQP